MFNNDIKEMFEELEEIMDVPNYTATGSLTERVERIQSSNGYRREFINGEIREYVYEDDEWVELGETLEEQTLDFDLAQKDSSFEMTADLSDQLPNLTGGEVDATLNNGVLNISFTFGESEE